MRYKRKPGKVEAFVFDKDVEITGPDWFLEAVDNGKVFLNRRIEDGAAMIYGCTIMTRTTKLRVALGDYVIRDEDGLFNKLPPSIFKRRYERI